MTNIHVLIVLGCVQVECAEYVKVLCYFGRWDGERIVAAVCLWSLCMSREMGMVSIFFRCNDILDWHS